MCRKLLITTVAVALVGFMLFGTSAISHVKHGVSWVRGQVKENVPVEYELERARELIADADPQIRKCRRVIAEKEVEIRYLEAELRELGEETSAARDRLRMQGAVLEQGHDSYVVGARLVSHGEMRKDAARRLARVKAADQMLKSKRERMRALEASLMAGKVTLEKLMDQKEILANKVSELEAKLRETEAKKAMTLNVEVDGSNLAKAKEILQDIQKRLDVELQIMETEQPLLDELPATEIFDADVAAEISAYLGGDAKDFEEPVPAATIAPLEKR